jgi:hypothetical protein
LDRKPTVWLLGERTRVVRDLLLDRQHLFGRPNAIRNVCRRSTAAIMPGFQRAIGARHSSLRTRVRICKETGKKTWG